MNEDKSKLEEIIDDITNILAFLIVGFMVITFISWLICLCIDFWKGVF